MQKKHKIVIGVIVIAGLIYLGAHLSGYFQTSTVKAQNSVVTVSVSPVVEKDATVPLKTIGSVEAYSTISVQSLVVGELLKVGFKQGDFVKQGQMLFEIDPRPYQAALAEAEGTLASDQAKYVNAEFQVQRNQPLVEKGYINQQDFEQLKANADAQAAIVAADKAAISAAQLQLEHATITSPIDGRTGSLQVDPGNIIKSASAVTLVTITQITPIYVDFAVSQQYLNDIRSQQANAPVPVTVSISGKKEQGSISFIDNTIDPTTDTIQMKATFANKDEALWPGQFISVTVPAANLKNALLVPSSAVQAGQSGDFVYVLNPDNTVSFRNVTVGAIVENDTVVLKGLTAGEKVVTAGQLRLADGTAVKVASRPNAKSDRVGS